MFDDLIVHEEPEIDAEKECAIPDPGFPMDFAQAILEGRRGLIQVSWDIFKQAPLLMVQVQRYVLIIEMSSSQNSTVYDIYGISPLFEPIQMGYQIPKYKVVNTTYGDITFEQCPNLPNP